MKNLTRMCHQKWAALINGSVLAFSFVSMSVMANADFPVGMDVHTVTPMENAFQNGEGEPQFNNDVVAEESTLNINSASVVELANTLPGIGMLKAQRIVEWRRSNGLFEYKDQLLEIPGIGVKTLERIQPFFHLGETPSAMLSAPSNKTVNKRALVPAPVLTDIVRGALVDAERARTLAQGG